MSLFAPLPPGPFDVVLCDPPWSFRNWKDSIHPEQRWVGRHYDVVEIEDLRTLPVASICSPNSALFVWVTFPMLLEGLDLMKAWGFTYKTCAFNWFKKTQNGKDHMGMGYYTRAGSEMCLLGVRGKPLPRLSHSVRQAFSAPVGRHSEKPEVVPQGIVELFGDRPRIELFARCQRPGWTCWGNQADEEQTRIAV